MENRKVIITGASGFIGGQLCKYLNSYGWEVEGWGRRPLAPAGWNSKIPYRSVDLCRKIAPVGDVHNLVHVAGLADDKSSLKQLLRVNVEGTKNLTSILPDRTGIVYISSASVYNYGNSKPVKESDSRLSNELSDYGYSKLLAEHHLQQLYDNGNLAYLSILRPRAVYGPGDTTLLPRILQLKKGNKILFPGHGRVNISMTHVLNLCQAVRLNLEQKSNGVFNITDDNNYTLRNVIREIFSKHTGIKWISIPLPPLRLLASICSSLNLKSSINHQTLDYLNQPLVLDISEAKSILGYTPEYNFSRSQILN